MAAQKLKPLIVIIGETASGKSALAMVLAKKFNGEIISADSWQVYKGFDVGTAKPSTEERNQIQHHLIDIADPKEGFSAAKFKKYASQAIENINKKGKLPILAGGSGLYIDSVIFDYGFLPAGPAGQRAQLNDLSINELLSEIYKLGIKLDGIDIRNKRRLIRLIESNGQRPTKQNLRPNTLIIGLKTDRQDLKQKIENRVKTMFYNGLEKEVKNLAKQHGWEVEPMKGIGYREFKDYFAGTQVLPQTRERIISSTLQLAKKQRTWFKRNKSIHWVVNQTQAKELVSTFLNK